MGLSHVRPAYRLTANSSDITSIIAARFVSLRLTDAVGFESDMLEITLADNDPLNRIQRPPNGAEIELWLGYDSNVSRMGLFVFDEFERTGWPGKVTIRARSAIYEQTPKGKTDLQTQKVRSWQKGTKIGDMVAKIAQEHSIAPAVSTSLAGIALPHYDQTDESDLSFLLRIMRSYDAIVKPSGGKLVVVKRGESQTISGYALPVVTINATEMTNWSVNQSKRDSPGTVIAYWYSPMGAVRNKVTVGSGEPVRRLRHNYTNQQAAEKAAQAELDKRVRGQNKFSGMLPGRPDLAAEGRLIITEFGTSDVDGEWLISRVEHELDESGYRCRIEAELPNGAVDL